MRTRSPPRSLSAPSFKVKSRLRAVSNTSHLSMIRLPITVVPPHIEGIALGVAYDV